MRNIATTELPDDVTFQTIEKKSLGHVYTIIFWNDHQVWIFTLYNI